MRTLMQFMRGASASSASYIARPSNTLAMEGSKPMHVQNGVAERVLPLPEIIDEPETRQAIDVYRAPQTSVPSGGTVDIVASSERKSPDSKGEYHFGGLRVTADQWRRILKIFEETNSDEVMKKQTNRDYAGWEEILDEQIKPDADPAKVLAPLDTVFLPDEVIDNALITLGIPEIMNGRPPKNPGAVFNGPGGTGKTILLKAIAKIIENCGGTALECNVAQITGENVGSLAKALDSLFQKAVAEAQKTGKPVYIYFDEADSVITKASLQGSVAGYFQDALNVMKKYIGNYPEIIVAISCNIEDAARFDAPVIRDGRLKTIFVGYPGHAEKTQMWRYFLREHGIIEGLNPEHYEALAKAFPNAMGAAIELFCRNYLTALERKELIVRGHKNLRTALQQGVDPHSLKDVVKAGITFERLLADVKAYAASKPKAAGEETKRRVAGFDRPENAEDDARLAQRKTA